MKPLFCALVVCFCAPSFGQKVTILTEHLPPYQLVEEGKIGGFATEVVKTVFNTAAIEYDLSHHLWSDAYQFTLKTANTCLYSTIRTEERETSFEWIGKVTDLNTSLYAKAGSNISIDSLEDAKQYSVTVMKNDFFHEYLLELGFIENQNLYVSNSYDTLMSLLENPNRKIDLIIANPQHMAYRLTNSQSSAGFELVLDLEEVSSELYLVCNKNSDSVLVEKLKITMSALAESGELMRLKQAWFEKSHQAL